MSNLLSGYLSISLLLLILWMACGAGVWADYVSYDKKPVYRWAASFLFVPFWPVAIPGFLLGLGIWGVVNLLRSKK